MRAGASHAGPGAIATYSNNEEVTNARSDVPFARASEVEKTCTH